MQKYIVEYKAGRSIKTVSVLSSRTLIQLTEIIESGNAKMIMFELEDGKNNTIALRIESINAIYKFGI